MSRNRLQFMTLDHRQGDRTPLASSCNFVLVPVACLPGAAPSLGIYQQALKEAQAVARPSILERDLLGVWN